MYIGRFIVVTPTLAAYRVSSRSFPNRKIIERDDGNTLTVVPTDDAEPTDNPYVSYNCARLANETAVIGNGSHVDPITEKIELGYPPRDAVTLGLLSMDFEKDEYDTPRIAGVVGASPVIGIVRRDAVIVRELTEPMLVATYEKNQPEPIGFDAPDATTAAAAAYDLPFDHPVCAAAVTTGPEWSTAIANRPGD